MRVWIEGHASELTPLAVETCISLAVYMRGVVIQVTTCIMMSHTVRAMKVLYHHVVQQQRLLYYHENLALFASDQ